MSTCKNYLKGTCTFGKHCRNSHSQPQTSATMETGSGVIKTTNPFMTPNTTPQAMTLEASVATLKEYIGKGCYAMSSLGAVTGDVSPEELRWYGSQASEAVTAKEKLLGISLQSYKPMTQGQVTASRVYPNFVPREQFTVLGDELLKELKW
jgi:hypothetical protein